MAVESNRGGLVGKSGAAHWSPIGMRVLAVDDNETCLQILETMLKQCQYQVTTARHAEVALRLLKENPNRFDLVITDVKMPDTDGFELLEMVGLEMDLPVIMLSAHSDSELVMRAVTHGACDYLLKPVRMEELKNIWQHVIRRKKLEPDDQIQILPGQGTSSGQSDNSNGKRKDHSEEEDSSRHKKPRVNWTQDKHQKFLIAVTQLGFDKAVPKKILDLMNVQGLTRENVASHLQKYRISLKKMQAKMAAQGGMSSSYLRMAALDGFRDVHSLDASLLSYPQGGPLSRLNSLAGSRMQGVTRPALIQPSLSQNLNNSFSCLQSPVFPSNQSSSLFQLVPNFKEFNSTDDPTAFVRNSIPNARSNPLVTLNTGGFGNLRHQNSIEFGPAGLSNAQLVNFPCNSLSFGQGQTFPLNSDSNSLVDTFSPSTCHMRSDRIEMFPTGADSSQRELIGNVVQKLNEHGSDYNYGMINNTTSSLQPLLSSSDGVMDQNSLGTLLERTKSHDVFMESLDGLMNTLDKRDISATTLLDGEYI